MTDKHEMPRKTRGWSATLSAVSLVAVLAAWGAPRAHAQIQVDVLTSSPKELENQTSASGRASTADASAENAGEAVSGLKQDKAADEAARKILPAPGTQMQSTEGGTLETGSAVAAEPSLKVQEDQVVLKAGESTETLAVKSGAELLRMLGLQTQKKSGTGPSELDESTTNSLFDVDAVKRLKGSAPTVVYRVVVNDAPLPDPMIVPWIRQAKLLQERFDKAVDLLGKNQVEQGREELVSIISDFPESDYATQAKALIGKLDDLNRPIIPTAPQDNDNKPTVTVELSPNIRVGAIIVDPENPSGNRAMIDGRAYKVGDEINGVPGHRVVGISEKIVQIEVTQSGLKKTFDVPVRPRGATE